MMIAMTTANSSAVQSGIEARTSMADEATTLRAIGTANDQNILGLALNRGTVAVIRFVALSVMAIVLLFGNTLTLWAVATTDKLRVKAYALITSLAFADLIFGISLVHLVVHESLAPTQCSLATYRAAVRPLERQISYVSFLHIAAIAMDRFVAVVHPLHYESRVTPTTIKYTIIGIWLISSAIALPPYFGFTSLTMTKACIPTLWPIYEAVVEMLIYLVNSSVVVIVYLKIWLTATQQRNAIINDPRLQLPPPQVDCSVNNVVGQDIQVKNINSDAAYSTVIDRWRQFTKLVFKYRATRTITTMLILYVLLWLPYTMSRFMGAIGKPEAVIPTFQTAGSMIGMLNMAADVFVYGITNKDFRRAFKRILRLDSNEVHSCEPSSNHR